VGFEGRFGYKLKSGKVLFLDLASLGANQNFAYSGNLSGSPKASDSIFKVVVGILIPFSHSSLHPYFGASLGFAKLSGTITGDVGIGTIGVAYSASGFDLGIETGLVKEFNTHWSLVGSLGFTYLSLDPKTDQSNVLALFPTGASVLTRGYSHITVGVGARYSF